jgi:hypothetical protein
MNPAGFGTVPMLLRDVVPSQFLDSYSDVPAYRLLDVEVTAKMDGRDYRWPGRHKNVLIWWKLADGHCVGWNENPSVGWAFPVARWRP